MIKSDVKTNIIVFLQTIKSTIILILFALNVMY